MSVACAVPAHLKCRVPSAETADSTAQFTATTLREEAEAESADP
jgi:hypothetical protein